MRSSASISKLLHALVALLIVLQCGASLAFAVNDRWHEAVHQHHGADDDDCPVVQLAHGLWDAPTTPVLAVPRPPAPLAALIFPDTARMVSALFLSCGVLEHAPPERL